MVLTQLVTVMSCLIVSPQAVVADSNFTFGVDNLHTLAVVNVPFNLTVTIRHKHAAWSANDIEVFLGF